ncbi:hypothetical protein LZG07_15775 [Microbacterium profundi]|uniref:hypothetical protein n=1 Tax=Microbacterium profundi TaxID=450380 RepID=UPI0027E024B1|nr:hypothetical protein [Microbacterium profundi]MCE7483370.1 hypothetical protein [Microbacterium profundi]
MLGTASVVVGGLVSAATGPLQLAHGSWAAAYLVLVNGVGQVALGKAQEALAPRAPSPGVLVTQLAAWNGGSAAVIGGTLVRVPLIVDAGGLMLVIALSLMIRTVGGGTAGPRWARWTYRLLLIILLVSIPIGLVLAHMRAV